MHRIRTTLIKEYRQQRLFNASVFEGREARTNLNPRRSLPRTWCGAGVRSKSKRIKSYHSSWKIWPSCIRRTGASRFKNSLTAIFW
jgi:hypothetical protein